ncbi:MAG: SDR family NAD(P)-dependent oxidoreductase [Kiritimatiellaeota bacterium]|nr:SDR family NAD(P)-dependent oxidoreductase [Kiritimatiellota bacterium]
MTECATLAPLVRGAMIAKTMRPCVVTCGGREAECVIDITGCADEESVAAKLMKEVTQWGVTLKTATGTMTFWGDVSYDAAKRRALEGERPRSPHAFHMEGERPRSPNRNDVVRGKIAVVTGGAQGFGEEIVRGLVAAGAFVFIADVNVDGATRLAESLNAEAGQTTALPVEGNVANEASTEAMFSTIAATAGGLDLCVSNAGVVRAGSVLEQDTKDFAFVTDVNYVGFFLVTKHAARLMKRQHLAAPAWMTDIIQINSKSGLEGSNKNGAYSGSKFGGLGLVASFALELVAYNIKVNAVCPGNFLGGPLWMDPVKGLFVQYLRSGKVPGAKTVEDVKAFYESKVPMKRGCEGPDVLRAIAYLVEQAYETGQALPVTGGQIMLH